MYKSRNSLLNFILEYLFFLILLEMEIFLHSHFKLLIASVKNYSLFFLLILYLATFMNLFITRCYIILSLFSQQWLLLSQRVIMPSLQMLLGIGKRNSETQRT